ncbi:hypothetical protein AS9A_2447 [Hoyosella subflava DQS3-9A1]|uniref:Haloalkane dehalogenase n=1 Tax=Hoyosella subflava (strain DSM 45089 / JCM 17490 / NBRC 109087 / DQS3-9A1) TaxID=443218 RepID=F6EEU4_HOYSD|nr:hypothetical protein AS9A_2447 [Hoyosella subflava DQS3-9A1]
MTALAEAAGLSEPDVIPGRHFFPEDSAGMIVDRIARIVSASFS